MTADATTKVPLGASTLVRKWYCDVDAGGRTFTYTVVASTDLFASVGSNLQAGNPVVFAAGAPAGITVGTTYYVIASGLTADAFKVSATLGGSALNVTADGGGNLTTIVPTWIGVFGMMDFQPNQDDNLEKDSDFDSEGYESSTKTAEAWSLEFMVKRAVTAADATAYDPGQELLRAKSKLMGPANSITVRWYEMTPSGPQIEAYKGLAAVSWAPVGGSMEKIETVKVKLTGQGKRNDITHPAAA